MCAIFQIIIQYKNDFQDSVEDCRPQTNGLTDQRGWKTPQVRFCLLIDHLHFNPNKPKSLKVVNNTAKLTEQF